MNVLILGIIASLAADAPPEALFRTQSGETFVGVPRAFQADGMEARKGEEQRRFTYRDLKDAVFNQRAKAPTLPMEVTLADGSRIRGVGLATANRLLHVKPFEGDLPEIPLAQIMHVRLRADDRQTTDGWNEMIGEKSKTDRLIVRRVAKDDDAEDKTASSSSVSLDVMEGVIGEVTEAVVQFKIDGDELRIKREKIEGWIYAAASAPPEAAPLCLASDIDDDLWSVRELALVNSGLSIKTVGGIEHVVPFNRLRKLDFESVNVRHLGDLTPENLTWTGRFEVPGGSARTKTLMEPKFDRTPEGPLTVAGVLYQRGIWMPARSSASFTLPSGFRRFRATVGIDDRVRSSDGVRLLVELDGKTAWERTLNDSQRSTDLDVEIGNARRMRITVDYAGKSFLGDQLDLCEAMLTK